MCTFLNGKEVNNLRYCDNILRVNLFGLVTILPSISRYGNGFDLEHDDGYFGTHFVPLLTLACRHHGPSPGGGETHAPRDEASSCRGFLKRFSSKKRLLMLQCSISKEIIISKRANVSLPSSSRLRVRRIGGALREESKSVWKWKSLFFIYVSPQKVWAKIFLKEIVVGYSHRANSARQGHTHCRTAILGH